MGYLTQIHDYKPNEIRFESLPHVHFCTAESHCGYFRSSGLASLDYSESELLCLRFGIASRSVVVVVRKHFLDSFADSKKCSYFLLKI